MPEPTSGNAWPTPESRPSESHENGPYSTTTLEPRLFNQGNIIHDVVEWFGPEMPKSTYRWGATRCGMRGKTYDVEWWGNKPRPCKVCERRRTDASE